jgi:hypothetical protein
MKGSTMKKKHAKKIHNLNKLLIQMMGVVKHKNPATVCSVCCAVVMIMYRRMDDEGREIMAPAIIECLSVITADQKKMQADERVH